MFCVVQRSGRAIRLAARRVCRTSLSWAAAAVPLAYETQVPPTGHGELDTPAVWVAPNPAQSLLLVTDKTEDWIEIHDPIQNLYLGRLGGPGTAPGKLSRPNAVTVAYGVPTVAGPLDVMFVVERDNHRVTAFYLPYGLYLGSIGNANLSQPMGIALHWEGPQLQLWVTDIGPSPQRVVVFDVTQTPTGIGGVVNRTIPVPGSTVLESIVIDPVHRRALICDESARDVMIYDLNGTFQGRFGSGRFVDDPEGIVIYDTGNGDGYVIVTDQVATPVQWEVFDRRDYRFLLQFTGTTAGTDGIALVQRALPNFPQGSFFAVHSDRAVHAYDWRDIAAATGLCLPGPCSPVDAGDPDPEVAGAGRPWVLPLQSPMRSSGTLRFRLPAQAAVSVTVYDLRGAAVATLTDGSRQAGWHDVLWDGRGRSGARLPSGVYFVRTRIGNESFAHKVTLVR